MGVENALNLMSVVRGTINGRHIMLPNPWGLNDGFIARESEILKQRDRVERLDPCNKCQEKLADIKTLTDGLPHPFWYGIHPTIAKKLEKEADNPESEFWNKKMYPQVRPVRTKIIATERGMDEKAIEEQVNFINSYLPQGSLSIVFATKGRDSFWNNIPFSGCFADDPHQMSIPEAVGRRGGGFNMLLLTESTSRAVPIEWELNGSLMENMNLHQVGHAKIVPTCWEFIDRTYSLVTPNELLDLTLERNKNLLKWFAHYGFDINLDPATGYELPSSFEPDSTSYLYEVKVIQRAARVSNALSLGPEYRLPKNMYWFRGFHFFEAVRQLGYDWREIIGGISAMNEYWLDSYEGTSRFDPILNSAVHSTDIGTQPSEEVCVDIMAQHAAGKLHKRYSYWEGWAGKIDKLWKDWETTTKGSGD
jgi:hypothetical protein